MDIYIKHTNISSTNLGQGLYYYFFIVEVKEDRTVSGTKQTVYKKMASVRQCEFEGKNVYDLHSFEKLNDPLLALAQILFYMVQTMMELRKNTQKSY